MTKNLARAVLIGAGLIAGITIGIWGMMPVKVTSSKMTNPDVYFECTSVPLPIEACRAFGRGELPTAEYMRTNTHYDECLARGKTESQCDAAMRVLYRDVLGSLTERVREREKKQEEDCKAKGGDKDDPFACIFPERKSSR